MNIIEQIKNIIDAKDLFTNPGKYFSEKFENIKQHADLDGDGHVSPKEWLQLIKEIFLLIIEIIGTVLSGGSILKVASSIIAKVTAFFMQSTNLINKGVDNAELSEAITAAQDELLKLDEANLRG